MLYKPLSVGIDLNPLHFMGLLAVIMLIIVSCVVIKVWKIANENPVNRIKSE